MLIDVGVGAGIVTPCSSRPGSGTLGSGCTGLVSPALMTQMLVAHRVGFRVGDKGNAGDCIRRNEYTAAFLDLLQPAIQFKKLRVEDQSSAVRLAATNSRQARAEYTSTRC